MGNKFINTIVKIIVLIAIIFGVACVFSIYSNAEEGTDETKKIEEEIRYLDTKILSLVNYLNNIDLQNYKVVLSKVESESEKSSSSSNGEQKNNQQDNSSESGTNKEEKTLSKMEEETIITNEQNTDWVTIEGELEILCSTWSTIILDLYKIGVSSEDILKFSDIIDEAIISVKSQDKKLSAAYLAKLYSYLPKFLEKSEINEIKKKVIESKSYIINAYALAETENWEGMNTEILKAESIFTNLVNDASLVNDSRKYNINKSYILIEELKNSLSTKDTGIFYIKYKNVLEELNIMG